MGEREGLGGRYLPSSVEASHGVLLHNEDAPLPPPPPHPLSPHTSVDGWVGMPDYPVFNCMTGLLGVEPCSNMGRGLSSASEILSACPMKVSDKIHHFAQSIIAETTILSPRDSTWNNRNHCRDRSKNVHFECETGCVADRLATLTISQKESRSGQIAC